MNNSRVWFCVMVGLCAGAGCATSSTYRIPATEMMRLATLDDVQRGDVVRLMPADQSSKIYAAIPLQPVAQPVVAGTAPPESAAAAPSSPVPSEPAPPEADGITPPPSDQWTTEPADEDVFADDSGLQIRGSGQINLPVPPRPRMLYVAPSPPHRIAPVMHAGGGGKAIGGGGGGHFHGGGGHGGGLHLGGGSGKGALIALVAAVVVVGAVVAIADTASSDPPPYDGFARIRPEHPVHLFYRSGAERVIKLRDLRPVDLVGLADTILKDCEGRVRRLPQPNAAVW